MKRPAGAGKEKAWRNYWPISTLTPSLAHTHTPGCDLWNYCSASFSMCREDRWEERHKETRVRVDGCSLHAQNSTNNTRTHIVMFMEHGKERPIKFKMLVKPIFSQPAPLLSTTFQYSVFLFVVLSEWGVSLKRQCCNYMSACQNIKKKLIWFSFLLATSTNCLNPANQRSQLTPIIM